MSKKRAITEEEGEVVAVENGEEDEEEDEEEDSREYLVQKKKKLHEMKNEEALAAEDTAGELIEIFLNDRLGKKIKIECNSDDTVGDLKKMVALRTGSRPEKLRIQKWYVVFKDHIMLQDYEVVNGMSLELYYN
ncbi:hypothetical protein BASA81_002120 [Batrachochytrium salamandrivorans]|nr:hypothetical protein BASA81_002120 [Batrachochytrium salamandrivorans]